MSKSNGKIFLLKINLTLEDSIINRTETPTQTLSYFMFKKKFIRMFKNCQNIKNRKGTCVTTSDKCEYSFQLKLLTPVSIISFVFNTVLYKCVISIKSFSTYNMIYLIYFCQEVCRNNKVYKPRSKTYVVFFFQFRN